MKLQRVTGKGAKALGCNIFYAISMDGNMLLANCEECKKRNECEKSLAKEEG